MSRPFYINFWNTHLCCNLVCSSSRVSLPASGLPPRLLLLPPANARQTGRARQPAGPSAMWVAAKPVDAGVLSKVEVVLPQNLSVIWFLIEAVCFVSAVSKCNGACECSFTIHVCRDYWANTITHLRCRMCCVLAGVLCQRSFCHMYWGCQRIGCRGCLAPFSGKCLFQQNSLGGFHCWACLLLGNFFKHGSLAALARINILGIFFFFIYFFICLRLVCGCVQN